ncbi:amidohydrolase [Amycolatopsis dendrobii]|uniref:Amidohydrolase n=1 Tax=Amycolatopsis dendrobii TaxID=2760662 RepID=A0A7W3ZEI7_9PSEU|nr:amidohydrolase [Amycolatopsis dendrobii]MBB1158068.1 amidohydrolase [Amycolatopsis dendrobii]
MGEPAASARPAPDLVVLGGTVLTLDRGGTRASALAARDGRITEVGDDRSIAALAGPETTVLDLAGRTVVPGFVESHNHPSFFGMALAAPVDAGSPPNDRISDIADRVRQAARDFGPGEWIKGFRYDDTLLADNRHPTRHDLDPASPRNPVLLTHVTGHFSVANSAALRAVGITAATPDPPGGAIARDERGEPTGLLIETAAFLVNSAMPAQGPDELAAALQLADAEYLRNGVTSVHDTGIGLIGGEQELAAYRMLTRAGKLRTRIHGYLFHTLLPGLAEGAPEAPDPSNPDGFTMNGIKIVADGSIQGRTGCLAEGYTCDPGEHGMMLLEPEDLSRRIAALDAAGWQVAVHGNGDAAIDAIIDGYARLGAPEGTGRRHRIEHCQTAREDQLDRMAENGIAASFFIKHVYYWGDRHRDVFLGPERARRISPLASARSRGIHFGLHSDTPVTPVPPLEGIWCAVARQTSSGQLLGPEQAIDVEAALRGYTIDAAYLAGEEESKGSLEVGKLADLIVLSEDPTTVDPSRIRDLTVDATVIGGQLVWQRDPAPAGGVR